MEICQQYNIRLSNIGPLKHSLQCRRFCDGDVAAVKKALRIANQVLKCENLTAVPASDGTHLITDGVDLLGTMEVTKL